MRLTRVIRHHKEALAKNQNDAKDPWTRTQEVWGLTFSPELKFEIRVRPESTHARATITEIRYKN